MEFAPYALVRLASVPLARVTALMATRSAHLIECTLALEAELEALRPGVETDLHAVVPLLDDPRERVAALALRRDVHNVRSPNSGAAAVASVCERLDGPARARVEAWLAACERLTHVVRLGEEALPRETARLRSRLWEALDEPFFYRGLAAANARFLADVLRWRRGALDARTRRQAERGLASYLLRAACKTSPFGAFLQVGAVPVGPEVRASLPTLDGATVESRFYVNRGTLARLCDLLLRPDDEGPPITLRRNPTLRIGDAGLVTGLVWRQIALLERPWRQEQQARFTFHPQIAGVLRKLPGEFTSSELLARLIEAGLSREQASRFAAKLVERGLILVPAVIDAYTEAAQEVLARTIDAWRVPAGAAVAGALETMDAALARSRQASAAAPDDTTSVIRLAEANALAALGASDAASYNPAYSEVNELSGALGGLGAEVCGLLAELGEFLRGQLALRNEYLFIEHAFLRRYGHDGVCRDVVGFLASLSRDPKQSAFRTEGGAAAPPAGARLNATAFVQLARQGAELRLVVNRVYEGCGWLAARFATGSSAEAAWLQGRLAGWLERTSAPAEPLDVPISGSCNDLQVHPVLTRRILAWPGEPIRAGRGAVVEAGELVLRRGEASGLLEFGDADGAPITPVYLGSVLPVPTWGSCYWLTVLANPLRVRRPPVPGARMDAQADVAWESRRTFARVVLRRAFWTVRSRVLTDRVLAGRGFARLASLARFCRAHGIPPAFFARAGWHADPIGSGSLTNAGKPIYINIANPWCVDLLARLARQSETTLLAEVLPGGDSAWLGVGGEAHVAELLVELAVTAG